MITKPKARKFRVRRGQEAPAADHVAALQSPLPERPEPKRAAAQGPLGPTEIEAIKAEGLTGRQLRMARRVAQKHGLNVDSDLAAVQQLRLKGIDPFDRANILELVSNEAPAKPQLPQTVQPQSREVGQPSTISPAERRASEIQKIQQDIAKRRRKKLLFLAYRLLGFVIAPTMIAGWYFFFVATPMYATKTEFVIQQAHSAGGGTAGLAGLFQGTSMATQQDATTVQSFLTSRAAMVRLNDEQGFKSHFESRWIDPIQRLPIDASNEEAFKLYSKHVKIGYDPTEGIIKMEVIAATPEASQRFSESLLGYAEEVVDQLTARLREDQMTGAEESYQQAETRREEALNELLRIQNEASVLSADAEASAVMQQINALETRRQEKFLELSTLQSAARPNAARVNAAQVEISNLESLIADLRSRLTASGGAADTLANKSTELRLAEENYQFQTILVQQAMTMMETARLEASRQVRYISLGVEPIAPDDPTYPKAFENTLVAFLIFAGLYLMVSLTSAILREQVSA